MDRRELEDRFRASTVELKTFVLEAHVDADRADYLNSVFGGSAELSRTEDAFVYAITSERAELWIDILDTRFWSVHTWSASDDAKQYLKRLIERRRDLDFMWIPTTHLEQIRSTEVDSFGSQFRANVLTVDRAMRSMKITASGRDSEELIDYIRRNPKLAAHSRCMRLVSTNVTTSWGVPYRLWGVPREVGEGLFHVEAVDLHIGRRVPMDVATIGSASTSTGGLVEALSHV